MTGLEFWLACFRPFARDGYRSGVLDDREVVLFDALGREVHLPRPSAVGWLDAAALARVASDDDKDTYEEARTNVRIRLDTAALVAIGGGT